MKKVLLCLFCFSLIGLCIYIITCIFIPSDNRNYKWHDDILIGHAFGEIDGELYTNSKEAFEAAYKRGIRTFEVDLQWTQDKKLVLCHLCSDTISMETDFLEQKINGKYTPMSFSDLIILMQEYPNITIVLDTKLKDKSNIALQFNEMKRITEEMACPSILDRIIVQVYNETMFEFVNEIYNFPKYIFTMYKRYNQKINDSQLQDFDYILSWVEAHNIYAITIFDRLIDDRTEPIIKNHSNIKVFVNTINDVDVAKNYLNNGYYGIYTDSISRQDLFS